MFLIFALLLSAVKVNADLEKIGVKISHGVYLQEIKNAIIFQSTLPLIFTAPMPKTRFAPPLRDPFCNVNHTSCDTIYKSNATKMLKEIDRAIISQRNAVNKQITLQSPHEPFEQTPNRSRRELIDPIRTAISSVAEWCCGLANTRQFTKLFTTQQDMKTAINTVSKSIHSEHEQYAQLTEQFKEMTDNSNKYFKSLSENFINFKSNLKENMEFQTAWSEFNLVAITHMYVRYFEGTRQQTRQSILSDCKNYLPPAAVIPQQGLEIELKNIQSKLAKRGWELAIPINDLSIYYTKEIAECLITDEEIMIKLKVPIKQTNPSFTLYKFLTVPQKYNEFTCTLLIDSIILGISSDGKKVIPITGELKEYCEINSHSNNLCLLPRRPKSYHVGYNCGEMIYKGASIKDLIKVCAYSCLPSTEPVITGVNFDTFVITNPKANMTIKCGNSHHVLPSTYVDAPGSLEIKLKCTCSLELNDTILIDSDFPCSSEEARQNSAAHVLPALWSKLTSLRLSVQKNDQNAYLFSNLSDSYNPNWTSFVPHLQITPPAPIAQLEQESLENVTFTDAEQMLYIYAPACTILLCILLLLFLCFCTRKCHCHACQKPSIPAREIEMNARRSFYRDMPMNGSIL